MSFSSISDSGHQNPFSTNSNTSEKNSEANTPTTTTKEARSDSSISSHSSLDNLEEISFLEEKGEEHLLQWSKKPGMPPDFTAVSFDEESDDESAHSLSSQETTIDIIRDKIETSGEMLSLADFKRVTHYSKKDPQDPLFSKLMILFEEYDRQRNSTAPQVAFDLLEKLHHTTNEYLRSFGNKSSDKLDRSRLEASRLLLQGIDVYFEKINHDLTKGAEPISSETDLTITKETSLKSNPAIIDALTKKLEVLSLSDASLSLSQEAAASKQEARAVLIHFLARKDQYIPPNQKKEGLPKLVDKRDADIISSITPEELKKILTARNLEADEIKYAQAQLHLLQQHIKLIQQITTINAAQKAQGRNIDVATREGFNTFLAHATSKELQAAGGLSPLPELIGSAIVTDWNQREEESLNLVSIE